MREILGIHHVTAIAGDAQRNLDFYTGILGLHLVKLTVNYDDPGAYHLYYGDATGRPGTILTFFAWPNAPRGRRGTQQVTVISFAVPEHALSYWARRFTDHGIVFEKPATRLGEDSLIFFDPDGLQLELIAQPGAPAIAPWQEGLADEYAIRGFRGVTLTEASTERTASVLEAMGWRLAAEAGDHLRYQIGEGGLGARVDVLRRPHENPGRVAVGTVHHVAWRTPNDEQQLAWRQELLSRGLNVSPVMDRHYFHSIYFREPGGVLFEIATDTPGFTIDEPPDRLGAGLRLPPWMERNRAQIEQGLPSIESRKVHRK